MKIGKVELSFSRAPGLQTPVDERPMLFRPLTMRGVTSRNRIVVAPMSQYLCADGEVSDWHLAHLGQFALGGAGIVLAEETAVEARGRRTHACAGLYKSEHVLAYRRITEFLKSLNAVPGVQLGHGGRRSSVRPPWEGRKPLTAEDMGAGREPWQTISASPIPHASGRPNPHALDKQEISDHVRTWADATRRAVDAGFEIVEIHGAHGYLINQFLSPVSNRRQDEYGGDLAGRMRFALEVTEAVRSALPSDKPLFFRASCVDGKGGHWDIDDTAVLARELKDRGVDMLDCSSGGILGDTDLPALPRTPGYHLRYCEHLREVAGIPTIAVGMITQAQQAEAILQEGKADLVALARELLWDPYWPAHAAKTLGIPDFLDVLPPVYAARLYPRQEEFLRIDEASKQEIPFRRKIPPPLEKEPPR